MLTVVELFYVWHILSFYETYWNCDYFHIAWNDCVIAIYTNMQTHGNDWLVAEMFNWSLFEEEKPKALEVPPSVHEQEDGTILAMCITGTLTKESLTSWIRFLERSNEKLSQIPVVFRLRSSPQSEIDVYSDRLTAEDRAQWASLSLYIDDTCNLCVYFCNSVKAVCWAQPA